MNRIILNQLLRVYNVDYYYENKICELEKLAKENLKSYNIVMRKKDSTKKERPTIGNGTKRKPSIFEN